MTRAIVPLRRELDAESMRILRIAHLRREYREQAANVVQIERLISETNDSAWRRAWASKLTRAQARLAETRAALVAEIAAVPNSLAPDIR